MKSSITGYLRLLLTVLLGIATFFFWSILHPEAMNYQEQNQLFLFSWPYFVERISIPGGLNDWCAEFITQFYYFPWIGSLWLALLYICLQRASWGVIKGFFRKTPNLLWYIVSFLPVVLLWLIMGDIHVLLSFPLAVLWALSLKAIMGKRGFWLDVILIPLGYWLIGPVVWIYLLLRLCHWDWRRLWTVPYLLILQVLAYIFFLQQWPLQSVMLGLNYYRVPLLEGAGKLGYNKAQYEVLRQDMLVRQGKWDEIISRAEKYQVRAAFSCECVNLALAKKRQLADRMFDFYQSGENALIMEARNDNTNNLASAEAFWYLGMVNSCLRYYSDLQESIINARKSGRFEKRITECLIVNGNYDLAQKHIDLLKQSLFYRSWAKYAESCLGKEALIEANTEWSRVRRMRFKNDFLYSYPEIDKIFGLLFANNTDNRMALDYLMAQLLLNGDVQMFVQYMPYVQKYGGYPDMPLGYQDAMRTIRSRGQAMGTKYGEYVRRLEAL